MTRKLLFGIDGSERAYQALQNLGTLILPADVHLHLFHTAPESSLFYPGELSTLSGEPGEWKKAQEGEAQRILGRAVDLLLALGLDRARIGQELKLKSTNAAQEMIAASEHQALSVIALAPKGRSAVKRFFLGSTTATVCQYAENLPVWVIGKRPLSPLHLLLAIDESAYAERIVSHVGEYFGKLPEVRATLLQIIPAKPPGYWDDGHILAEKERSERERAVQQWRAAKEARTDELFLKLKARLAGAGMPERNITIKRQSLIQGIARDILTEARKDEYNLLAFGRRGGSAITEFALGSRAAKMLHSPLDCSMIVVN